MFQSCIFYFCIIAICLAVLFQVSNYLSQDTLLSCAVAHTPHISVEPHTSHTDIITECVAELTEVGHSPSVLTRPGQMCSNKHFQSEMRAVHGSKGFLKASRVPFLSLFFLYSQFQRNAVLVPFFLLQTILVFPRVDQKVSSSLRTSRQTMCIEETQLSF